MDKDFIFSIISLCISVVAVVIAFIAWKKGEK